MLEIKNLNMSYGKNKVLKDVNIRVAPGQIHGLIGENSAGKTTLIKCAVGIYKQNQGSVTYGGEPIYDNPAVKQRVGYVADSNEYFSGYSVTRLVRMYAIYYDRFDKTKFNELNQIFQVPVKMSISTLSKGQKMRLAFMLELAKQPDYMILDEPTSGLDPVAKAKFYEVLIEEVEQRNMGVLISSHNLDGLERICDSVSLIHQGVVEQQLSMDDMKSELTRLNVVFEGGAPKKVYEMPEIIKLSNVGSIYSIVVRDFSEKLASELRKYGASLIEPVEMSLEELFVTLEENRNTETEKEK